MRSINFQIFGHPEPPPELLPLRAGPLTLLYDSSNGMVRRIKLGEREVLRGIYAAVRDRNWGTVPAVIQETRREIGARSFCVEFTAEHHQAEIDFVWRGRIEGTGGGELRYEFDGEARGNFLRNRIGFCVLHPIGGAGVRARQTRTDGSTIEGRFPDLIEPQIFGKSSFQQLRAVAHEVSPEVWAEVSFEGDVFEMEDQRNWTDASFKTYCTPLSLPFPVEVKQGSRIKQTVTLRLLGKQPISIVETHSPRPDEIILTLPETPNANLPGFGLGVASHGEPLTDDELASLRRLQLGHLRVAVRLGDRNQLAQLEQSLKEAAALDAKLELALHLPRKPAGGLTSTLELLQQRSSRLARILALREGEPATSPTTLAWLRSHLGNLGVPIGSGSDRNFCELNREYTLSQLALDDADFLFWSINPQVHAVDHLSVMETLEAQPATAHSAQAFAAGRELVVSPVTLKQRFNPVATDREPIPNPNELPPQVDTRQLSQFAAAWTLGSIAALTSAGAASVTYYETTGWRGVMERTRGSPLPEKFPTAPGELFPVFRIFERLAGFRQCAVVGSPEMTNVAVLSLFESNILKRTLVANLTQNRLQVRIQWSENRGRTLSLGPYAFTELEHT